ncbi:MAG: phosphoglycerate dehydrogenase [Polyangiaceae bacterium UTPRO1]|jgi:D-3-phosphoglycerate dehydrogenase|nr:phosphoglycerate dehydrogenase [Myxococcales bacterium]OQY67936.1 MAG: phosphoglycerate dehydrogenase [Polyangiaceae bacterium UTPRO1]
MVYRVLVTDPLDQQGVDAFAAHPEIELRLEPGMKPDELARVIGEYDALVIRSGTKVTAETLKNPGKLRVIGRAGIGVDNIDVAAATARGIVVMNTPGGNNVTTAEHAITLMLAVARFIPQADASLRAGKWERTKFTGTEVCNKTLGVIGLGNIGRIVAERAQGLRMRVIGYDPFVTPEAAAKLGVELVALDDLYARADFISVHVPMTSETKGLIGAAAFAKMKKGVRIVNAARGGIVDEAALHDAIVGGKVAGAALDVFAAEPPSKDHPLLALPQVVVTPHLGAATNEAQINVAIAIAEQITNFLLRGEVQAAVNMPSVSAEMLQLLRPHLLLGEKLGSLLAQLSTEPPSAIAVEYAGTVAELDIRPVTIAVLRGFLSRFIADVNYVNAPALARERGIAVKEARADQPTNFVNSIKVRMTRGSGTQVVEGAVFGANILRLVRIDDFYMEAVPEGYVLMLNNRDVPGVVGRVGSLLGQHGINIAGLELGREKAGGMAISFVHVDEAVPESVLAELRRSPDIVTAQLLRL